MKKKTDRQTSFSALFRHALIWETVNCIAENKA